MLVTVSTLHYCLTSYPTGQIETRSIIGFHFLTDKEHLRNRSVRVSSLSILVQPRSSVSIKHYIYCLEFQLSHTKLQLLQKFVKGIGSCTVYSGRQRKPLLG